MFLLQGSSHRPPHVERRERAEGVHQGQHTPTLPSVVLGGFRLLRPVGLRPVGSELKLLEFLHCATNCVYCGNKFCVLSSQVSEWAVDHGVPGGTDKDGWQYAADFPTYVNPLLWPLRHNFRINELIQQENETNPAYFFSLGHSTVTKP